MEIEVILMVCFFVFLAGLIDSIAGGGGLIALPAYLASGLPVHMVLGSVKFSSTLGTMVSTIRFWRSKKIHLRTAAISVACALVGSVAGAKTVLYIDDYVLKIVLLIIIPIVAIFVIGKKNFGNENEIDQLSSKKIVVLSMVTGLAMGFYDGLIGPGTGTFLIFAYSLLLRLDLVTASGNAKLVNLASNSGALILFLIYGQVYFLLAVPAAICCIVGNFIGSGLAIKNGSKIIKPIFILVLGALLINLVYIVLHQG